MANVWDKKERLSVDLLAQVTDEQIEEEQARFDMRGRVKTIIENLEREGLQQGSLYRYLVRQFPILIDGKVPKATFEHLKESECGACTAGDYVAVSTENLIKQVSMAMASVRETYGPDAVLDFENEVRTTLAHEYTHILCEHPDIARAHPELDNWTLHIAAEIQANRGYQVDKDSAVYQLMVTEENWKKTVPGIENCKTLGALYQALKKYRPQLDQYAEALSKGDTDKADQIAKKSGLSKTEQQAVQKVVESDDKTAFETPTNTAQKLEMDSPLGSTPSETTEVKAGEYSNDRTVYINLGGGTPGGMGGKASSEELAVGDPIQRLRTLTDKNVKKNLERELLRLRSVIKGQTAKTKTKTYSRPPRRPSDGGLFKKGLKKDRRANPSVLLALDKSGSMSEAKIVKIAETVNTIIKTLGKNTKKCYICLHDGRVLCLNNFRDYQKTLIAYVAEGGNNFPEVYDTAKHLGCDVVLNVGDGLDEVAVSKTQDNSIKWYDVLVEVHNPEFYYTAKYRDKQFGLERNIIDATGQLPPESLYADYLERNLG